MASNFHCHKPISSSHRHTGYTPMITYIVKDPFETSSQQKNTVVIEKERIAFFWKVVKLKKNLVDSSLFLYLCGMRCQELLSMLIEFFQNLHS